MQHWIRRNGIICGGDYDNAFRPSVIRCAMKVYSFKSKSSYFVCKQYEWIVESIHSAHTRVRTQVNEIIPRRRFIYVLNLQISNGNTYAKPLHVLQRPEQATPYMYVHVHLFACLFAHVRFVRIFATATADSRSKRYKRDLIIASRIWKKKNERNDEI